MLGAICRVSNLLIDQRKLIQNQPKSVQEGYTRQMIFHQRDIMSVPVVMIEGKREVTAKNNLPNSNLPVVVEHAFYYEHLYDPDIGALKQLPTNVKLTTLTRKAHVAKKNKGK